MRQECALIFAVIFTSTTSVISIAYGVESTVHYAVTEAKNTVTNMVTSKIQKTYSSSQCEFQRKAIKKDYLDVEFFDVFHSVCLTELPVRLSDATIGRQELRDLVINYVHDGIETTEVFYQVDPSWTDVEACQYMTQRYKQLDPNVQCYAHQQITNYFDKYRTFAPPTAESVLEEDEAQMVLDQDKKKEQKVDKYWTSITESQNACRKEKSDLIWQACWERALPEKCRMLVYQATSLSKTYSQWYACAQSCEDASFYS